MNKEELNKKLCIALNTSSRYMLVDQSTGKPFGYKFDKEGITDWFLEVRQESISIQDKLRTGIIIEVHPDLIYNNNNFVMLLEAHYEYNANFVRVGGYSDFKTDCIEQLLKEDKYIKKFKKRIQNIKWEY